MPKPLLPPRIRSALRTRPSNHQDGSDTFTLAALLGARPRHRLQLPAEPPQPAEEGSPPPAPPAQALAPSPGRHISNPVRFGFMLALGVSLACLLIYLLLNIGALAGWLTGAVFIGLGLDPAVRKLEKRGLPRAAGVTALFLIFLVLAAVLILWVLPVLARQAFSFITGFPHQFEAFLKSDFFSSLDERYQIRSAVDTEVEKFFTHLTSDSSVLSDFLGSLLTAGSTLAEITTGTLIVLFLSIYLLASLPTLKAWFIRLAPASKRDRVSYLTEKITSSVGQYVMGQALVAICNATCAAIIMLIAEVPFAPLLALFVLTLAFIPLVGGVSAAVLVSLISLIDSWQTSLAFLIPYLIYLQVEAYFISPRIMSKTVAVPGAVAIIAVVAGGTLWGVLGAIIAIPLAASLLILVNEVLIPRQDQL